MLERIEGHYVRGYGDSQKSDAEIGLLRGATQEADALLASHEQSRARLRRVVELEKPAEGSAQFALGGTLGRDAMSRGPEEAGPGPFLPNRLLARGSGPSRGVDRSPEGNGA